MGYRQGKEDRTIRRMEKAGSAMIRKKAWLPEGRMRHLADIILDGEKVLCNLDKPPKVNIPRNSYLFDMRQEKVLCKVV